MEISYERKNVWEEISGDEKKEIQNYSDGYKNFLDKAQTERLATEEIISQAKKNGFASLEDVLEKGDFEKGDKIYYEFMNKTAILMVAGENLEDGMNIVASHTDSPRLDLKANPLYEGTSDSGDNTNLALMKTHYYGGVKKYQWVNLPLALLGVSFNKDGEKIDINIGLDDDDPVFYINDLLIHLSADQLKKTMKEGITGEQLNVVVGHDSSGHDKDKKNKIKENVLSILNEKYGLVEEDFQVSELTFIPALKARDVGLDRSLIAAYGHDDKSCAYASLEAILQVENPSRTAIAIFVDKEEIGSVGATGLESYFFENFIADLLSLSGQDSLYRARKALQNSKVLSGDVNTAVDPTFSDVVDGRNAAYLGCGVNISKYTGSGGKGGSNDANAEFLAEVRKIFDDAGVIWQTGELGKVDQGGGGTVAYILAKYGAEVVDCGPGMLSMHAPYELISKADAYMTYKAYHAFLDK